ncbi:cell division protein ZipA C-terminal FtsZ-binding domain-containing protein [Acinetobacter sp. c3-l95]|uniref:cell division protein ZipA C-terminal FtsZ-binding domain-containing protein n=1 Tax=Acinetobacter sp. c3-l95 TaxID=3342804 RepID=UPI0035BB5E90
MDIRWYIGIIVAVLMILWALRLLLRRPYFTEHLQKAQVETDESTGQPILPRHLREQLNTESTPKAEAQSAEAAKSEQSTDISTQLSAEADPALNNASDASTPKDTVAHQDANNNAVAKQNDAKSDHELNALAIQVEVNKAKITEQNEKVFDAALDALSNIDHAAQQTQLHTAETSNHDTTKDLDQTQQHDVEKLPTVAVNELGRADDMAYDEDDIDILSQHLIEQERKDQQSALQNAQDTIALYIYPNHQNLTHAQTLKILKNYGLRFGEMSCFHRYEYHENAEPVLIYSALKLQQDGSPTGFDLDANPNSSVTGLAFFLTLPHVEAAKSFDIMATTAVMIAKDIEGTVFDDNLSELTIELRSQWHDYVAAYQA